MAESTHACYALTTTWRDGSYVGYTVDPHRRLRQHNGELVGGARRTTRTAPIAPWTFLFVIVVAHDAWGAHEALSLEWHLKLHRCNKRKLRPRLKGEPQSTLRFRLLQNALRLPKFAPFVDHMSVFVKPAYLNDAFDMLCMQMRRWSTSCVAVLPLDALTKN